MSSKNRPYVGKDGNRYSDYFEKQGADTRYDQRQKLIEEQQKTNRLIKEQNIKIKNNRLNSQGTNYVSYDTRIGPYFLYLSLIIAPILIFSKMAVQYGIYIFVAGLIIEIISAYNYNKKIGITNHFFEISLLIIAILCFMITVVPISKIKNIISLDNGTYTIIHSNNSYYKSTTKLGTFEIDGEEIITGKAENLDLDKKVTITINYTEYISTNSRSNKWVNKIKKVEFYPRAYFDKKENSTTLASKNLDELYKISISEIFENY